MDPNQGNPFGDPNFDKNPFEGIMAQIQSAQSAGGQGMMGQGAPQQPPQGPPGGMAPQMQGAEELPPNQLVAGEEGGNSQLLIATIQQLNRYITAEDDQNNILIARSIINLVAKLLAKEQEEQTAQLPQDQERLAALQPPQEGAPQGVPPEGAPPQGPTA